MKNETVAVFKQLVAINNEKQEPKILEQPKQKPQVSEAERKRRAVKEYMQLLGYKPFANPVEEILKQS